MKAYSWFSVHGTLMMLLVMSGMSLHSCYAFEFSPLEPVGWMWSGVKAAASGVKSAASGVKSAASGVKAAASGVKTVVTGAADMTQKAYRLIKPTSSPDVPTAAAPAASELQPPKSGHKPIGCFEDIPEKTPKLFHNGGAGRHMNKAKCSSNCGPFGAELFGLRTRPTEKAVLECWCGHSFTRLPSTADSHCTNRCPDEEAQTAEPCGGDGFVSVYQRAM